MPSVPFTHPRHIAPLPLILVLTLLLAACGRGDEAEPTPEAPEVPQAAGPSLLVDAETVRFRETESDDLAALDEGEARDIEPGANIVVDDGGRATLSWEGFLRNQLLAGTDSLLSLSLPAERRAILDQAAGTARYQLSGDDPADLQVIAGWITIAVAEAPADFIVSFIPGQDPSAWVAMLDGDAQIVGRENVNLGTLESGQAGAWPQSVENRDVDETVVPGEAGLPLPQAIDPTRVLAWYQEVGFGEAEGSIASVAFRCTVGEDGAQVYTAPDAEADPAGDPLAAGDLVDVSERDASGDWLRIHTLTASVDVWVAAEDLTCNGPTADVPLPLEPDQPTPTARPLPTRAPVLLPTWTPGPTPTPIPSVTPAAVTISFSAEDDEIEKGECTKLRWEVTNAQSVYLDGDGVVGSGSREVCPGSTKSYNLKVNGRDGVEYNESVEIEVEEPEATETVPAEATNTPRPQATNTPQPTAVPPTATSAPPTDEPFPTATHVPTSVPTDPPPPPTATDPPPPATEEPTPEPTSEPQPTATDGP